MIAIAALAAAALVGISFFHWYTLVIAVPFSSDIRQELTAWQAFSGRDIAFAAIAGLIILTLAIAWLGDFREAFLAAGALGIAALVLTLMALAAPPAASGQDEMRTEVAVPSAALLSASIAGASFAAFFYSASRSSRFKRCPDCTRRVAAQARACRFCGFRFDGPPA